MAEIEDLRREHAALHAQAERFRRTLRELNEVEHPAIVAGGAALAALAEGRGSADQLRATGAEVLSLIDAHFQKEEEILFPMARQILDARTLREVARQMDAIEPVE